MAPFQSLIRGKLHKQNQSLRCSNLLGAQCHLQPRPSMSRSGASAGKITTEQQVGSQSAAQVSLGRPLNEVGLVFNHVGCSVSCCESSRSQRDQFRPIPTGIGPKAVQKRVYSIDRAQFQSTHVAARVPCLNWSCSRAWCRNSASLSVRCAPVKVAVPTSRKVHPPDCTSIILAEAMKAGNPSGVPGNRHPVAASRPTERASSPVQPVFSGDWNPECFVARSGVL